MERKGGGGSGRNSTSNSPAKWSWMLRAILQKTLLIDRSNYEQLSLTYKLISTCLNYNSTKNIFVIDSVRLIGYLKTWAIPTLGQVGGSSAKKGESTRWLYVQILVRWETASDNDARRGISCCFYWGSHLELGFEVRLNHRFAVQLLQNIVLHNAAWLMVDFHII